MNWQTLDLDIILYHRFHIRRLYDHGGTTRLPDGRKLPVDPWQNEHFDLWSEPQMLELFREDLDEIVAAIVRARPKVLGLSLQSCNEQQTRYVVNAVKEQAPEVVILVGGFSCYNKDIGLRAFPETEYMCIGEADLTVGPLMEMLAAGERPGNVAGVLSVHDDPDLPFIPAPMPHDLDQLEVVKYDWFDSLDIYRNWDGYQLTPVIASRGCRWSRCTFCAERFYWRIRSPKAFVDEMEWLMDQGCHLFMFNESDLNGMPEVLLEICEEIIRRDLKIKLTGQLRIHRKSDKHFFQTLAKAGFVVLRFGVDAFSANTLKLQAKGYDKDRVRQNLKDCWEAGIFTEVNWVIGVPGETWDDVQEGVDFIVENKPFIGRVANINPLILAYGSVYWVQPEVHNIHFRGDKDTLLDQHPRAVPAHLWYSDEPYIDHEVRREYFSKVVKGLYDNGFDVGAWAARIIEDVETGRDGARAGIAPTEDDQDGGAASKPAEASAEAAGSGEAAKAYDTAGGRADAGRDVVLEGGAAEASGEDAGADRSMDSFSALRGWDLDHDGGEDAAVAQEMQKAGAYLMRAAGNLPVLRVPELSPQLCVLRHSEGWVAASPAALKKATGLDATPADGLSTTYVGDRVEAQFVWTKGIVPQYEKPVGSFNVALYDGFYYAIPRGFGGIEWGKEDPANLTGVMVSETREGILEAIEAKLAREGRIVSAAKAAGASVWRRLRAALRPKGADAEGQEGSSESKAGTTAFSAAAVSSDGTPRLEGKLEGYRIYEYEGWYYGVPSSLGDIQLDEVDVMEMPGVIRDVSKDVLEEEIRGLSGRLAV